MVRQKKKKVAVGMSGGVDSSVAAALLLEQGYEVIGVFMHFWTDPFQEQTGKSNKCCSLDSFMDARRVCQKLGIPIYSLNYADKFKKTIVNNFIDEYQKGNTPNPCVLCNQFIKLGGFVDQAFSLGCDYVATGHYARVKKEGDMYYLYEGLDEKKDQSYFLYRLAQKDISRILFPLGDMTKEQVRQRARELGLPVFAKQDSQEICFVSSQGHNEFLKRHIRTQPGNIVSKDGEILGHHEGLAFYTIGQRKGMQLSGGPFYVIDKKQDTNELVVTKDPFDSDLTQYRVEFSSLNWTSTLPQPGYVYSARIRYKMPKRVCRIEEKEGRFAAIFSEELRGVSPGQSLVIYEGEKVIGGGIICAKRQE